MLNHLAIIMDGNGRWGKTNGKSRGEGHIKGCQTAIDILDFCTSKEIPFVTVYALSVQNLNRPPEELSLLLSLAKNTVVKARNMAMRNNAKVVCVGNRKYIREDLLDIINDTEKTTSTNTGSQISICLCYGGREDIVETIKNIKEPLGGLTTHEISKYFVLPNVDLLVRTGGDHRISNFLLWECAYAELHFTNTLWPDFTSNELELIIEDFKTKNRTYGEVKEDKVEIIPELSDVFETFCNLIDDYKEHDSGNIESLYEKLSKNRKPLITVDETAETYSNIRDETIKQTGLFRDEYIKFISDIDDIIDSGSYESQCRQLKLLYEDFSAESVYSINPSSVNQFIKLNTREKMYLKRIYECEYLQRTANVKSIPRFASNYLSLKLNKNDLLSDETCLPISIVFSFCDDFFDEQTDIKETHYINDEIFMIVKNAIFEIYEQSSYLPYIEEAMYVACSILIHRFIRPTNEFKNMSECVKYVLAEHVNEE